MYLLHLDVNSFWYMIHLGIWCEAHRSHFGFVLCVYRYIRVLFIEKIVLGLHNLHILCLWFWRPTQQLAHVRWAHTWENSPASQHLFYRSRVVLFLIVLILNCLDYYSLNPRPHHIECYSFSTSIFTILAFQISKYIVEFDLDCRFKIYVIWEWMPL